MAPSTPQPEAPTDPQPSVLSDQDREQDQGASLPAQQAKSPTAPGRETPRGVVYSAAG